MKYETEYEKLRDPAQNTYFKPEEGVHTIVFLEDLKEPVEKTISIDGKDKKIFQSDVLIEFNKERKVWSITKAETHNSLWGQLLLIGKHKGSLVGESVTIMVKGQGKSRDYTITEAVKLRQQQAKLAEWKKSSTGNKGSLFISFY